MRKIIQIAFDTYSKYHPTSDYRNITSDLFALCDDGTIWVLKDNEWIKYDIPIPQDEGKGANIASPSTNKANSE